MAHVCPSRPLGPMLAPSRSAARRARRFRLAFQSGARCVCLGAPGLERCSDAGNGGDDEGVEEASRGNVVAAECVAKSGGTNDVVCQVSLKSRFSERSSKWQNKSTTLTSENAEKYFADKICSTSYQLKHIGVIMKQLSCSTYPREDQVERDKKEQVQQQQQKSSSDKGVMEHHSDADTITPLDAIYEIVAELSVHMRGEDDGWIEVHGVIANACKLLPLDVEEARGALDIWCSLAVMKYNPVRSKIKLIKYTSLKEHPLKKKKVASKISVPSLFGVADTFTGTED